MTVRRTRKGHLVSYRNAEVVALQHEYLGRTFEELLLKLSLGNLNLHGSVDLLLVAALVIGIVLNGGGEEGVDEGCLSQS